MYKNKFYNFQDLFYFEFCIRTWTIVGTVLRQENLYYEQIDYCVNYKVMTFIR